jgi:hypothetical protein
MFDCARLDCVNDSRCVVQDGLPSKPGRHHRPAVYTGILYIVYETAESDGVVDQRGEILAAFAVCSYMLDAGKRHDRGRVYTVGIVGLRGHQAVCCEQNRRRDISELLLLALPCGPEIALQLRMFLQFRISVSGQHFAMSVYIYALSVCLLQEHFKVAQVMA